MPHTVTLLASGTIASAPTPQVGQDAGESMIDAVPVDGDVSTPVSVAEQNAVLIIALPVILLVVGAILHLVRRPAGGEAVTAAGHHGGLVLMAIGGALTFAMLAYLMLIQ